MKKLNFTTIVSIIFLATTVFFANGCTSLSNKISLPSWHDTASPQEIIVTWDTILRTENDKNYRGFAARVMFYESGSKKALKVRGNFDVYVFDEEATGKAATVPAKIVRYQMNDLKALQSESKMFGTSYTLWVPWDEMLPDAEEKKLSLFVRFKCEDGTVKVSQQATVLLPGSPEKMAEKAKVDYENPYIESRLRQTAYLEEKARQHRSNPNSLDTEWKNTVAEYVVTREDRPQAMVTTTINVPGVSRDGIPNITREQRYALASDEQKYQSRFLLANAQQARLNQQADPLPPTQNAAVPISNASASQTVMPAPQINQVQFQSQEPSFQSASAQPSMGLVPLDDASAYREFLAWKQQREVQQPVLPQQPIGNYAAAPSGTTWQ